MVSIENWIPVVFDWLPSCPREKDFWWENEHNSKKKTRKKNSVPVYEPLNKLCGFECQRANLNFLKPFFVANCDDLLHIIVRYTWLCSSRGILKTNNGREGVKCKLFCPRGLRNRVARPQTTSAKKATHFWLPFYYSWAEKNRRHWPAHLGTWLRQKKSARTKGSKTETASRRQQRT